MAIRSNFLPRWLGFSVQGDLGPWTFYTNKNRRIVFYDQAPPLNPPSRAQSAARNRLVAAAYDWQSLPADQQANWRRACKRLRLECVGFGLFYYWHYKRDAATITTIEQQTGIILLTAEAKNGF